MKYRIERKTPKVGVIFERDFAGKHYVLKIVKSKAGMAYELNDKVFMTPTAAAKSITKFEVNGWRFWHMKKE